jgi:hypothetical protein
VGLVGAAELLWKMEYRSGPLGVQLGMEAWDDRQGGQDGVYRFYGAWSVGGRSLPRVALKNTERSLGYWTELIESAYTLGDFHYTARNHSTLLLDVTYIFERCIVRHIIYLSLFYGCKY